MGSPEGWYRAASPAVSHLLRQEIARDAKIDQISLLASVSTITVEDETQSHTQSSFFLSMKAESKSAINSLFQTIPKSDSGWVVLDEQQVDHQPGCGLRMIGSGE